MGRINKSEARRPMHILLALGGVTIGVLLFVVLESRSKKTEIDHNLIDQFYNFKRVLNWFQVERSYSNSLLRPIIRDSSGNNPLFSWRLLYVSGFTEGGFNFDEPWDSVQNKTYEDNGENHFCRTGTVHTCIMSIVEQNSSLNDELVFSSEQSSSSSIRDESNLIVLVEVYAPSVNWMSPNDLSFTDFLTSSSSIQLGSPNRDSYLVGFANGEVWLIEKSTPRKLVAQFMKPMESRIEKEEVLAPYRIRIDR